MMRRRLCSYTIMYIAGIAAGYFMLEKVRLLGAAGFMLAVLLAAALAGLSVYGSGASVRTGAPDSGSGQVKRERIILAAMLFAGFLIFCIRYSVYDRDAGMYMSMNEQDACSISGRVIKAEEKDGGLSLTLNCGYSAGIRRRVIVYKYADDSLSRDFDGKEHERAGGRTETGGEHASLSSLTGAEIRASGKFKEIMPADDPGCFDRKLYMRAKGICVSFSANSFEVTDKGDSVLTRIDRYLLKTRDDFTELFSEDGSGFIRGVVFGDKSGIDADTVKEFNMNATGHILAVSGLHIGFLYGLLRALTGRRRTGVITAVMIAVIVLYGGMTQWSAATLRASLVTGISLLAIHFRRPFDLLTSVSLAALLMLIRQPYQLFDAGFQMSFLAMTGIAFFTKPLSSVFGTALGGMFAVQLSLMPITAYTFYRVNLLSLFINIPVIMLASVLVPLCLVMLVFLMLTGLVLPAGISIIELMAFAVIKINHMLTFGGAYSYRTAGLSAAAVAAFYITAFALSSEWARVMMIRGSKRELMRAAALLIMPFAMLSVCMHDELSDDEIVFASVGQGDCTHIRVRECGPLKLFGKGKDVLIDGGGRDGFDTGERILMPYLLRSGAGKLDMALVTHLHMDHFKGICELCRVFPVGAAGIPADYNSGDDLLSMYDEQYDAGRPDVDVIYIGPGTKIDLAEDVYIESIWPAETVREPLSSSDPNEHNTVYMIHYRGIKIMVTGDLLEEDELEMIDHYRDKNKGQVGSAAGESALKCDILKVAHHGSRSSTSEAFLDAADPGIAVIQAGRNNLYGHPHQKTLDRLEARGIKVFRTDMNGAVGIDIRRDKILIDLFRNYQ